MFKSNRLNIIESHAHILLKNVNTAQSVFLYSVKWVDSHVAKLSGQIYFI